jgi:hypothetical protein
MITLIYRKENHVGLRNSSRLEVSLVVAGKLLTFNDEFSKMFPHSGMDALPFVDLVEADEIDLLFISQ